MTEEKKMLFSQDALKKLLWPLSIEQFLAIAMGMADTVMAASCGEAVVSGISLVDSICVLLIGLFTAMASGGAVVAAQYMGHGDKEMVGRASNQLFLAVGGVALLFMTIALIWNKGLLQEFIFILWRCPFLFWEFITVVRLCSVRWEIPRCP